MKVYKYRGIESDILERDLNTFLANQFFAPKFEMLNDPFEANFKEIISNTLDAINAIFSSVGTEKVKAQLHNVIAYKNKLGILSLSKNCYSEQMWAYYASSNHGYCVEYDLEKLKDKTQNFDFSKQLDIAYSDDIPTLGIKDLKNDQMFQKMYGTKKQNWRHEEEIRLVFNNSSLKKHHQSAITAIYFGYQASENLINTITNAFTNRDIQFYKIIVNKEKNGLEHILLSESKRLLDHDINKFNFEIISHKDNSVVENYYIHLKDKLNPDELKEFAQAFREKYCYKPSNLNIFNTSDIPDLIDKYPLKGKEYIQYADAFIAVSDFDTEDSVFEHPYKDFYYEQQLKELEKNSL